MMAKRRDADATKTEILKAAEALFAEKGYAGTKLSEIAKASGVSGALVVFHFKNKLGVYDAVKKAIIDRCIESDALSQPVDESFQSLIENFIASMFRFYRDNPTMLRLANWGRLEGDDAPWPGEDEWHHIYLERIRMAQKCGEIRDDMTPLNVSIAISGLIHIWWEFHDHFLKHAKAQGIGGNVDEIYLKQCLSFVFRGLLPDNCIRPVESLPD